jgi:LPS sulfotransferase NodH
MPISFVIVGAPRTGSTLLVKTLNSLPGMCCHGELLGSQNVRGYEDGFDLVDASKSERAARLQRLLLERNSDPVGFLQKALSSDNAASGFKALYSAFLDPRWNDARTWLLAMPDIRFIHLTRNNALRRFVSEQILLNGGPNHSGAGGRSETPIKVHIDIDAFEKRSAEIEAERSALCATILHQDVLNITYEELSTHTATTLARACQFLALDDAPPIIELAHATLGLVLPAAGFTTGATIVVDGGVTIRNA